MFNIDFTPEQLVAVYRNTSNEGREAIKEALGDNLSAALPITARVKTYEDAVRELGEAHPYVKAARDASWRYEQKTDADLIAYLKMRVIVAALNEGWEPQFTEDEYRYFPWYTLFTKEDVDDMTDERKKELGLLLWGGSAIYGSLCGLACADSYYAWSSSSSYFGSRLAFKSKELAEYAGKQFIDIFAEFYFRPNPETEQA